MSGRSCLLTAWLALVPAAAATAGEAHYLLVFGAQSSPKRLENCHSWATFVRASWDDADPSGTLMLQQHTLGWVPASLDVRVWDLHPVPGANLDLHSTLAWVYSRGEAVTLFGPMQVRKELYDRSLEQLGRLQRGEIAYRAIDTRFDLEVSDCIHSVTDIDPDFGRGHFPLIRVGRSASRYIASQVAGRSAYDQRYVHAGWLVPALGLDRYPIEVVPPQALANVRSGHTRAAHAAGQRP